MNTPKSNQSLESYHYAHYILIGILILLIGLLVYNQIRFNMSQHIRYESRIAAEELRQSSDDLTRMARTYAVTGDNRYEKMYWEILAIRNGVLPRPEKYENIYWDYLAAGKRKPRPDGPKNALSDRMNELNFSEEEFQSLQDAEHMSNSLVWTERVSMNAMKGIFLDDVGAFTKKSEMDFDYAQSILFDEKYHENKIKIMKPIDDFFEMLDTRTLMNVQKNSRNTLIIIFLLSVSILGFIFVSRKEIIQQSRLKLLAQDSLKKLKDNQIQLIQQEKLASIGQMTSGIGHEINNPVNFINLNSVSLSSDIQSIIKLLDKYEKLESDKRPENTFSEVMKFKDEIDYTYLKEAIPDSLRSMKMGTEQVIEIANGLRNFSRMDSKEKVLADITEILDSTLSMLKHRMKDRITLTKDYQRKANSIKCFPSQLGQVFMNIIGNAIDSIPDKGEITITTTSSDIHCLIKIKDNGIGMSEETRKHIMETFFTTKERGKGTGLGLSISQDIIQKHGGRIEVTSHEGVGSEFTVVLPNTD